MKRVLITGAAGLIGGVLRDALSDRYELSGIDVRPVAGMESAVADMRDLDAVHSAFEGVDTVIDLAAVVSEWSPWDEIYENNFPATHNAFEAGRRAGVKRVVFASSNHATGMYEGDEPYASIVAGRYGGLDPSKIPHLNTDMPIRPDGPYGIGKAFGEAVGRYYSDRHGLSVICLRIGTVNRENRPVIVRQFATLLSHADLTQLVGRCVEAPGDLRFAIFYGVSDNTWRFWDIGNSRDLVGYEPRDDAEQWR